VSICIFISFIDNVRKFHHLSSGDNYVSIINSKQNIVCKNRNINRMCRLDVVNDVSQA
jgi:hypothetical protein